MKPLIYHFGAGNIGKGLIGLLLKNNGYAINFVDANINNINKLKNSSYKVQFLGTDQTFEVKVQKALMNNDADLVNNLIEADYLTTSMGAQNFDYIVDTIVDVVNQRKKEKPLILICFENYFKASEYLYNLVLKKLNKDKASKLAFINVVVDCIIPDQNSDILIVENFFSIYYQKSNLAFLFKEINTDNQKIIEVDDFAKYFQLKILGVNGLHTLLAFLSLQSSFKYVNEVVNVKNFEMIKEQLMKEMTAAISGVCELNETIVGDFLATSFKRFLNLNLQDCNTRILRNLKSKLRENERLYPIKSFLKTNNWKNSCFLKIYKDIEVYTQTNEE